MSIGAWTYLSHSLSKKTPMYGGREGVQITETSCICHGDSANSLHLALPNHVGTHVDAPRHFFDAGACVDDYSPDFWFFESPLLIDCPKGLDGLIEPSDIDLERIRNSAPDCIFFRTGFEQRRAERSFWENNPGVSPELGVWLKKELPSVRLIGLDVISVNRWQDRPTGRIAHKNLLGTDHGAPILIIEDMKLSHVDSEIERAVVSPLLIEKADGGPCTVMVSLKHK
jgi:kynurenine formamidase